jgi:hypothetical protein
VVILLIVVAFARQNIKLLFPGTIKVSEEDHFSISLPLGRVVKTEWSLRICLPLPLVFNTKNVLSASLQPFLWSALPAHHGW